MSNYNSRIKDELFNTGKRYLNNERFKDAIEIFDELISENYQFLGEEQANTLLQTSLTNRGLAKCGLARINHDLDLYKHGMSDFKKSIEIANPKTENEKCHLTAYRCLRDIESEIKSHES